MKYFLITLVFVVTGAGAMAAQEAQRPPMSKAEVLDMVSRSVPSILVIGAIHHYGIAFTPTDEVLDEFDKAGADDALLRALEEKAPPEIKKPLSDKDVLALVARGLPSGTVIKWIKRHGIDFQPSQNYLSELRSQGGEEVLLKELRATAVRPYSKDELVQSLSSHQDPQELEQRVRERGIDFEPSEENLAPLCAAGAPEALLQAVRAARRTVPFVPQLSELSPPNPNSTSTDWEGKDATLICTSPDMKIQVMASPNDVGRIVATLECGERVTFLKKDSGHVGIDEIRYRDGELGFVADHYFSGMTYSGRDPLRATQPPSAVYKPEPGYTDQARRAKNQGAVTLWIVIDPQGNVTDVQEASKPLGDGLDEMAIETVKTWKFRPATQKGVSVPARVMVEISFRLDSGPTIMIPSHH